MLPCHPGPPNRLRHAAVRLRRWRATPRASSGAARGPRRGDRLPRLGRRAPRVRGAPPARAREESERPDCFPTSAPRRALTGPLIDLLMNPTREVAAPLMARGAAQIVGQLVEAGRADGIVSLGGTQGTTLATSVMRQLPYGFPKLMVSTMASG